MHKGVKHELCSACHFDRSDPERWRMCENAVGRGVIENGKTIVWCSHQTEKRPLEETAPTATPDVVATA